MKKRSFLISITLLFFVTLFLAACGDNNNAADNAGEDSANNNNEETGAENAGDMPKFINMLTGGTSGTYYPLGGEIAQIISDETGIDVSSLSSNASADNIVDVQEGEAEIAMVQTDVMANAEQGIHAFEGNKVDNVLALGSLYPETIQIVTTDKSDIKSVEDLKGKTVSVGAPGSGTYINAEQILEVHGMTMDDIDAENLDFGESTGGIQDGNIHAAFITAGTPTGAVEGLSATENVEILPIEQDKIDELIEKYPYYAPDTIEAGVYGLEEEINTVAVLAMFVITDSLSDDVVYDITAAIYDNTDKIAHDKGKFITLENALNGIGVDLHPGAERYFEEQGLLD